MMSAREAIVSGGFRVDLGALTNASQGIDGVLYDMSNNKISDIKVDKTVVGHDRLASSISDFCDRWDLGVNNLAKDGRAVADRLRSNVDAYDKAEKANTGLFSGIGQDPAGN
jgi:hypothetical protein